MSVIFTKSSQVGGVSDHGDLTGLLDDDHIQYLLRTDFTTSSGDIILQIPTDYISDSEMVTISGDIVAQFPTDFYTQAEVDTISGSLDASKADLVHTHTESDITDLGDYASTTQLTTTSGDIVSQIVFDHGALDGLADNDHPQYLLTTDFTTASGDIIAQIPVDFYTTGQVDTISGALSAEIDADIAALIDSAPGTLDTLNELAAALGDDENFATTVINMITTNSGALVTHQSSADHDDRYYTESEVDVLIAGASGTTDHSLLDNLDYASAGHTGFVSTTFLTTTSGDIVSQFPSDFYSQAEITTISGDIVTQIPSVTDFVTDTEITTISGDIIAQIPDVSDFITDAEVTTISGDIVNQIPSDFYSQAETTTISGDIVTQIPTDFYTQSQVDDKWATWSGSIDHNTILNTHNLTTDIDHNQLTNYSITEHRTINDSSSGSTDLWSAEKIGVEITTATGSLTTDHGELIGLLDDDHTQYLLRTDFTTYSGTLQMDIDGKSDTGHTHTESDITDLGDYTTNTQLTTTSGDIVSQIPTDFDDRYYTETEINNFDFLLTSEMTTISGDIVSQIPTDFYSQAEITTISGDIIAQIPTDYISDNEMATISGDIIAQFPTDFYTQSEVNTISGALDAAKSDIGHTHTESDVTDLGDYATKSEITTISGNLQTNIDGKPDTLLELTDTPAAYDVNKYLKSTASGTEWATVSGGTGTSNHSELTELDYASAGHTGFAPTTHSHIEDDITDLEHDAIKIQGRTVSSGVPLDTQVLSWSDSNSQWEPNYQIGGSVNLDGGRSDTNYGGVPLTDGGDSSSF